MFNSDLLATIFRLYVIYEMGTMAQLWNTILLYNILHFLIQVSGICPKDKCERRQYVPIDGFFLNGKVIAMFEEVPLKVCVSACRRYLECRSFNMKWLSPSKSFGTCALLEEAFLTTSGAEADDNYTHFCKLLKFIII